MSESGRRRLERRRRQPSWPKPCGEEILEETKLILEGRFAPKDVIPVNVEDGVFSFERVVH